MGEICTWFKNLSPRRRIEYMCTLVHLCTPLELRFVGTVLEDYARKDHQILGPDSIAANEPKAIKELEKLRHKQLRSRTFLYLALMRSKSIRCGQFIYNVLERNRDEAFSFDLTDTEIVAEEVLTLLTLAANHPVLTFGQRIKMHERLSSLDKSDLGLLLLKKEKEAEKALPFHSLNRSCAPECAEGEAPLPAESATQHSDNSNPVQPQPLRGSEGGPAQIPFSLSPFGFPAITPNFYSVQTWMGQPMAPYLPVYPAFLPPPVLTESSNCSSNCESDSVSPASSVTSVGQLLNALNLEEYSSNLQDVSYEQLSGMSKEEMTERGLPEQAQSVLLCKLNRADSETSEDSGTTEHVPPTQPVTLPGASVPWPLSSSPPTFIFSSGEELSPPSEDGDVEVNKEQKDANAGGQASSGCGSGEAPISSHHPVQAQQAPPMAASSDCPLLPNPAIPPPPGFEKVQPTAHSRLKGVNENSNAKSSCDTRDTLVTSSKMSYKSALLKNPGRSKKVRAQAREQSRKVSTENVRVESPKSTCSEPAGGASSQERHVPNVQPVSIPTASVQVLSVSSSGNKTRYHPKVATASSSETVSIVTAGGTSNTAATCDSQFQCHSSTDEHEKDETGSVAVQSAPVPPVPAPGLVGQRGTIPECSQLQVFPANFPQCGYGPVPVWMHQSPNGMVFPHFMYPYGMVNHPLGIPLPVQPVLPSGIPEAEQSQSPSPQSSSDSGSMTACGSAPQASATVTKEAGQCGTVLSQQGDISCSNCGAKSHTAGTCTESTVNTMLGKPSYNYELDYIPRNTSDDDNSQL